MSRTASELIRTTEHLRRDQIAQRAYALYEQRGRQEGFAVQDWLQAEQELARATEAEKFLVKKSKLKVDRSAWVPDA